MPERRWMKWLRGGAESPPAHPGSEATRGLRDALLEIEATLSDRVVLRDEQGAADRLTRALGAALAGQRSTLLADSAELPSLQLGLADAVQRLTPLVVHAVRSAGQPWGSGPSVVAGSGAFVAAARNAQHASDLALAVRLLAEWALRPGVLLSEDIGDESLLMPSLETIRELLGWPDELVDSSTLAQRALFGDERRRAVRWFDPDHPVASGGRQQDAVAVRSRAGARIFFDAPVADLADRALSTVSDWTGRELSAVGGSSLDGADYVIVAWGRGVQVATEAIEQVRAGRKLRAGVLSITLLRPFPAAAIGAVLGQKRRAVVVLGPDEDPLAPMPPFAREVIAAAPGLDGRVLAATFGSGGPTVDQVVALLEALPSGDLPARFPLDGPALPAAVGFPRRDALLQPLKEGWPEPAIHVAVPRVAARDAVEPPVPELLRRIGAERAAPDSLPRFWGAVVQPDLAGQGGSPDPISAARVVPAGASALQPPVLAKTLPVLDSAACTGCGDCWPACPESAIGVGALALEPLLTAASRLAGTSGRPADALRRSHKHLATKLAGSLQVGAVDPGLLDDSWTWLAAQLGLAEDELAAQAAAFDSTAAALVALAPSVTEAFFRDAEQGGAAELLVQAVDPASCTGCGLCVAACGEEALSLADRAPDLLTAARERWTAWEALPDTTGETIARLAPEIGDASAALLSRHASRAQLARGSEEPGSGGRIALRLVAAAAEQHGQRVAARQARALAERSEALRTRIDRLLTDSLAEADPATLAEALAPTEGARPTLGRLADRLSAMDVAAPLDRNALLDCARTGAELARVREQLVSGADGLGRARYGFVASARGQLAELLTWPRHPWFAPGVVAEPEQLASVARGIAEAMLRDHLDTVRLLRRADLLSKPPANLPARLSGLAKLRWQTLTDQEQADCPALLVLVEGTPPAELARLVHAELPVKVVVLDGPGAKLDTGSAGAFALSSSIGAPDHLFAGVVAALGYAGGAWMQIDAPEPARDGFEVDRTVAVAAEAIEAGTRLLKLDDPRQEAEPTGPLVDEGAIRQELREELQADQAAQVEAEVAKVKQTADGEGLARLTERLMGLAGYTAGEG